MACSQFNPDLPFETAPEKVEWLLSWEANLFNDLCLQRSCSTVCLPGNTVNSEGCKTCLNTAFCNNTLSCVQCLGDESPITFEKTYGCTVDSGLPVGVIVGIVLGAVVGVLLLTVLIIYLLYITNKLPLKTRLWIDNWGKQEPKQSRQEKEDFYIISIGKPGEWGGNTGDPTPMPNMKKI